MKRQAKFVLIFSLFYSVFLCAGFAAGTLVKVPGGYELIENLKPGMLVYSVT